MKKYINLLLLVLFTGTQYAQSLEGEQTIQIKYPKPYEYKYMHDQLIAKAELIIDDDRSFKVIAFDDGRTFEIVKREGKHWVWLPVIGQPEIVVFKSSGKKTKQSQLFVPLVTSDWDYFNEGTFHIISSSHQDIAWMDTPEACRHDRVNEIIAPALDIMKEDENYYFGMEQALNLKEFIEDYPERKDEVLQRYREGRFAWGATYNQPYEGMQMGEQLIREMYFGKLWIKQNFEGIEENTAYNTDVPARTLQFPQVLAKSGTENLFVSRMREGFYNWHSPDGSSVFTYSPGNYGWGAIFYKLFNEDAIEALRKIQGRVKMWSDYYRKHNLPPHFAIVLSNDASGPEDYGHVVREWNQIVQKTGAKIPALRHSTVPFFLNEMNQPEASIEYLEGERPNLWAYIHGPGHHKAIKASRVAGRQLPSAEIFATIEALLNKSFDKYPTAELTRAFEESIYPDHGWGGKNGHITDSIFRDKLEFAASESDRLLTKSQTSISERIQTKRSNGLVVFNDLSWERSGLASASVPNAASYYVIDEQGAEVPSQSSAINAELIYFNVKNVPSIGFKTYYLKKGKTQVTTRKSVTSNSLKNDFYTMHLSKGGIAYLFDNELNKEILKTTRFAGGEILTLGYNGNGAGEFTQMTEPNMDKYDKMSNHDGRWSITEDGEVFTEFENRANFEHAEVVQRIRVYHWEKKIDFFVDLVNWDGTHNREFRFAIPLNAENSKIKYEVPLAIAEVGKTEMKEAPGGWAWGGTYDQKPVTIHPREVLNFISSETSEYTVTLATDVALADWIDPTREAVDYDVLQGILLASHKSCHGEGNWYHQTGNHHFKFSLTSHLPGDQESFQFGTASNQPFKTVLNPNRNRAGELPGKMSFFRVSDPMVKISTIKKSEEDENLIIRLVEMEGADKQIELQMATPIKQLVKTNLIEEPEAVLDGAGKNLNIKIGHNSIDTYQLILEE